MRSFFVVIALCLLCNQAYKIDPNTVSISGLSSGAFFAIQYQVAYSSSVVGVAIFAGGPYYCAQDSMLTALESCMTIPNIDLSNLESDIQNYASQGSIDLPANITRHNVYLYSGSYDFTVVQAVVESLKQMETDLGAKNIQSEFSIGSGHGVPTLSYGVTCAETASPYLMNCNYDGAGNALGTLYGNLNSRGTANNNNIDTLAQSKFTPNGVSPSSISLDTNAYVYVPTACQSGATCKLHVVFHGCEQGYSTVGNVFVQNAGFNEWAEANNIIVLYPQAIASTLEPENPSGCWDWWGYNEAAYATQQGSQMTTVNNMVKYLLSGGSL